MLWLAFSSPAIQKFTEALDGSIRRFCWLPIRLRQTHEVLDNQSTQSNWKSSSPQTFRGDFHGANFQTIGPWNNFRCSSKGKKGRGTSAWLIVQKDLVARLQTRNATCVGFSSDLLFLQSVNKSLIKKKYFRIQKCIGPNKKNVFPFTCGTISLKKNIHPSWNSTLHNTARNTRPMPRVFVSSTARPS